MNTTESRMDNKVSRRRAAQLWYAQFCWCFLLMVMLGVPRTALASNNEARFIEQVVPAVMTAGKVYEISFTLENTGSTYWTAGEGYKLGSRNPGDNRLWVPSARVEIGGAVAPGSRHTFAFSVVAPSVTGRHDLQFQMVREFVEWFGQESGNVSVLVVASPSTNAARFVSQQVPTVMDAGKPYDVAVTVENVGGTTWTTPDGYWLGSQNPGDNLIFAKNRVGLASSVAPGQQRTLTFSVVAPSVGGVYDFQWKMVKEFVEWFGEPSELTQVTVLGAGGENVTYFHNDAAGTPLLATDAKGNLLWKENYHPFGGRLNKSSAAANNKLGFAGAPFDENYGLSYMGARYYDPLLGRFLGPDPVDADLANLHSLNRYSYANNNPYRYVDPDGRSPVDVAFLLYDLGKLSISIYTGVGIGPALADVAISTAGVFSPVPFAGQAFKAARAAERAVDVARVGDRAVDQSVTVIGRTKDLKNLPPGEKSLLDRLPKQESEKANWKQNAGVLRYEMKRGKPIKDVSFGDDDGQFLNAERYLLKERGWTFNKATDLWMPPK